MQAEEKLIFDMPQILKKANNNTCPLFIFEDLRRRGWHAPSYCEDYFVQFRCCLSPWKDKSYRQKITTTANLSKKYQTKNIPANIVTCLVGKESKGFDPLTINTDYCVRAREKTTRGISTAAGLGQITESTYEDLTIAVSPEERFISKIIPLPKELQTQHKAEMTAYKKYKILKDQFIAAEAEVDKYNKHEYRLKSGAIYRRLRAAERDWLDKRAETPALWKEYSQEMYNKVATNPELQIESIFAVLERKISLLDDNDFNDATTIGTVNGVSAKSGIVWTDLNKKKKQYMLALMRYLGTAEKGKKGYVKKLKTDAKYAEHIMSCAQCMDKTGDFTQCGVKLRPPSKNNEGYNAKTEELELQRSCKTTEASMKALDLCLVTCEGLKHSYEDCHGKECKK